MKIGILGAGRIGATAARLFVGAGHEIAICNSRPPESLQVLIAELGVRARAMRVTDVIGFGRLILLAVPWHVQDALLFGNQFRGKIVMDAMNAFRPDGGLYHFADRGSSEIVMERMHGAHLVKTLNTISYRDLARCGRKDVPLGSRRAIYVAGDHKPAKQVVARLIEDMGFAPVDTGSLHFGGRLQEPDSALFYRTFSGFEAEQFLQDLRTLSRSLPGNASTEADWQESNLVGE